MAIPPVNPVEDSRVSHRHADLNGKKYHYLLATPAAQYEHTIFLIHGWPDLSAGWRNQIPLLVEMGFRVVVPDMMGYGGTDAPEGLEFYTFKRAAGDIKELAQQLGCSKIILGGHDWGGAVVYRTALWYPELITHLFVVCTPYRPPTKNSVPFETLVKTGLLPTFTYQLHLASGEVEKKIQTEGQIRQFLNALYGGNSSDGKAGFDVKHGTLFDNLPLLNPTRLVSPDLLDFYAKQYSRNGIHSTLNWYRTWDLNFQEELTLEKKSIDVPVLYISASYDMALPPSMSEGMEEWCRQLTRRSVDASHWALWEAGETVNAYVRGWLEDVLTTRSHL